MANKTQFNPGFILIKIDDVTKGNIAALPDLIKACTVALGIEADVILPDSIAEYQQGDDGYEEAMKPFIQAAEEESDTDDDADLNMEDIISSLFDPLFNPQERSGMSVKDNGEMNDHTVNAIVAELTARVLAQVIAKAQAATKD